MLLTTSVNSSRILPPLFSFLFSFIVLLSHLKLNLEINLLHSVYASRLFPYLLLYISKNIYKIHRQTSTLMLLYHNQHLQLPHCHAL